MYVSSDSSFPHVSKSPLSSPGRGLPSYNRATSQTMKIVCFVGRNARLYIYPYKSSCQKGRETLAQVPTIDSPLTANCWRMYYSPSVTGLRSDSKITWSFLPPPHFAVNELSREDTTSFRILKCPAWALGAVSFYKLRTDVPLCCSLRGGASGLKQCLNDSQRPSPRDQQSQTFPRWLYYLTGCLVDRWLLCPAELKVCLSIS